MDWTEIAAFATGALCVFLVVRQHVGNFAVGMANNVLFIWLFVGAGLYADAGLQVVYIGLAVFGWWCWVRGGDRGSGVVVARPSARALVACVGAVAVITAALQWVLLTYTDSTVAGWDAVTTALSLVAQLMLSRKWIASWWFWIAADLVYIPLYAHKGLWLTAALYVLFLGLCVAGLVQWRRAERDLRSRTAEPVAA